MTKKCMVAKEMAWSCAALIIAVAYFVAGCVGGGGDESVATAGVSPVPGPSVPAPVVSPGTAITSVASAGAGQLTINAANTLVAGDFVVISGTASYNGIFSVISATPASFVVAGVFGVSEAGFFQNGGGLIAGCSSTGDTGVITVSVTTSRFSGIGPLSVFFDATGTSSAGSTKPFHELEYRWNFGDPGSGSWTAGSRANSSSRNSATGAVAAHVFETPGTYTVGLTVTDGTNTVSNSCVQIAVQSPDVAFSGNNTICLSTIGDFIGCPSGAQQVTHASGNFVTAVSTYIAAGKRLLLRKGETWTAASSARISANGPGILGAYPTAMGSGAAPLIQMTGNASILLLSSGTTPGIKDWRVMDLEFDGMSRAGAGGIGGSGGIDQLTLLRLSLHDMQGAIGIQNGTLNFHNANGNPGHTMFDQMTIADSAILRMIGGPGGGGTGAFLSAKRLAVMGNVIDVANVAGGGPEHALRITHVDKGVIGNNTLARAGSTKHALKLHNQGYTDATSMTFGLFTQFVQISDNKFVGGGGGQPWTAEIAPQNSSFDERIRDIVLERNWFVAGSGTGVGMVIAAAEISYRNNICDMSGTDPASFTSCVLILDEGTSVASVPQHPIPTAIRIQNNTVFRGDIGNVRAVSLQVGSNITIQNNLVSGPNAGGNATLLLNPGGVAAPIVEDHNVIDNLTNLFINPAPTTPAHFSLNAGNVTARNQGAVVPIHSDFFIAGRPSGAYDIGATEQ